MKNSNFKQIVIEISGACNAHCPFCITGRGDIKPGKMMSLDLFKKTVLRLKELELAADDCILALYSWGEPFLNPEINEILEFCADVNHKVYLSTNASVYKSLSSKAINAITYMFISMPGFSQTAYNRIHGFDVRKIKANIENFVRDFKKYSQPGFIQLRQHIYQWNPEEIPMCARFAARLGVDFYPYYAYVAHYDLFKKYKFGQLDRETEQEINNNILTYYLHNYKNEPDFECPQFDMLSLDESANVVACCNLAKNCDKFVLFNIFDENAKEKMCARINMEECQYCFQTGLAQISHTAGIPLWANEIKNCEYKQVKKEKKNKWLKNIFG